MDRISSDKRRALNKCRTLINATPLGIHIEISASPIDGLKVFVISELSTY